MDNFEYNIIVNLIADIIIGGSWKQIDTKQLRHNDMIVVKSNNTDDYEKGMAYYINTRGG